MARKKIVVVEEPASTCGHCKHAWFVEDKDSAVWFCRRYPPAVTYDFSEQTQCSTFAVVASDQTCGEFSPKLDS
jgi:hypothetical protein